MANGKGTNADPWKLKTPPLSSDYEMYLDEKDDKEVIVCVAGKTTLLYDRRAIDDVHIELLTFLCYNSKMNTLVEQSFKSMLENTAEQAINLAEYSAIHNGKDIPVGAIALFGAAITGRGYAVDGESGHQHMHAEIVAIEAASQDKSAMPTTIVTSMEPCEQCQDLMAEIDSITTVAYVTSRLELSKRHLVNRRRSIEERTARYELPYNVVYLDNPILASRALEPLYYTDRDIETGITRVDSPAFQVHLNKRSLGSAS